MSEPDHFLSITTDVEGQQVFVHVDAAGLDHLIRSLTRLRQKLEKGVSDHDHMMTDAWAGEELSTPRVAEGARGVQHIKIWAWTPEKIRENHLKA
jgi:hypothetical protein